MPKSCLSEVMEWINPFLNLIDVKVFCSLNAIMHYTKLIHSSKIVLYVYFYSEHWESNVTVSVFLFKMLFINNNYIIIRKHFFLQLVFFYIVWMFISWLWSIDCKVCIS